MKLDQRPLYMCILLTYISALQNGIDVGITYCKRAHRNTGVTLKVEKGDYGHIASAGYPNNYTTEVYHGHLCNVELQACSTCKIRLKFVELRFPDCESRQTLVVQQIRSVCVTGCDHLRLFEVDQPYHRSTERNYFSDSEGDTYDTMSSGVVIQHCMSNGTSMDGKRFYIRYEVIDKIEKISGTITAPLYSAGTGTITSPNFPLGYALNGETFTYMIQNLDPYGHVRLVFDDWDLAEKSHIQVYDDLSGPNLGTIYGHRKRPTIMSNGNTLVLVFNVGSDKFACCNHIGFRATYTFVSDEKWTERPRTDCSDSYLLQNGGVIKFHTDPMELPQWYDCVWIIKRYIANYPDGVLLRLAETNLGKGWMQSGINSLEIYEGVTSLGNIIARYTTDNFTAGDILYSSGEGLYIRLRGVFNMADKLKMVYTAVSNFTGIGCPSTAGFMCENMWCIPDDLTCDGIDHCGDNSDENPVLVCVKAEIEDDVDWIWTWDKPELEEKTIAPVTTTVNSCFGMFRCHDDSACIHPRYTCDKIIHCNDRSDESGCSLNVLYGSASGLVHSNTFPVINYVPYLTAFSLTIYYHYLCT
ncbi:hypothetical protein ACF0H5_006730 [Mactra antiquata]